MSRGFTVALIGPDGAGKTTVACELESTLNVPVVYLYMGVSAESSNRLLPTTRLVRAMRRRRGVVERGPRPAAASPTSKPGPLTFLRAAARTANRMGEESYRQLVATWHLRRGRVVLFDRHFFADYYLHDVATTAALPLSRRIHGFFISHVLPRPDMIIYLDAPAHILFARKGEGTIEMLEEMRKGYDRLGAVAAGFFTIDADRSLSDVVHEVDELIVNHASELS